MKHVIENANCLDVVKALSDESVHLTVTSPPYDSLRDYGDDFVGFSLEDAAVLFWQLLRATCTGGVLVWVVADETSKLGESTTSFKQALLAVASGWQLHDTMIYEKAQAFTGSKYAYFNSFEYMFVFRKSGKVRTFNPLTDRRNVRGGVVESTAKAGMRSDGSVPERKMRRVALFGKRKNVWRYVVS